MLRTTLTNLRARKLRVLTTSLAVLIGVAFMAGTMVLSDTMTRSFDELFEDIYAGTSAVVRGKKSFDSVDPFGAPTRPLVDEALVAEIAGVDGVAVVEGQVEGYAHLIGSDGEPIGNPGSGAPTFGVGWPEHDEFNPLTLNDGRAPQADDEVVIDQASANLGSLGIGDTTIVVTAGGVAEVTVVGLARWGDADSPLGASITVFTPSAAQRFLGTEGRVNQIQIVAADGVPQEVVRDRIAAILPDDVEAITGAQVTAEDQAEVREVIAFFGNFMLVFALVALFVGSFIIYNTFSILVAQRNREMALMRAIGASRRQVLGSLLLEAAVVGVIASVLGLVAGVGVAGLLKALLALLGLDIPAGGVVISQTTIIAAFFTGVVVSLGAAIIPARKASQIPPVAAMSEVAFTGVSRIGRRAVVGLVIVAAGAGLLFAGLFGLGSDPVPQVGAGVAVLFIGVAIIGPLLAVPATRVIGAPLVRLKGLTGTLARENALRNPKRTASTASALMIGVALVCFITIVAASARASLNDTIDRSFRGDFVVDSGTLGMGGFDGELTRSLHDLDEVAAASPARIAQAEVDGQTLRVLAVDPSVIDQIFDVGVVAGSLDALDETSIAVWDEKAANEGWGIGDTVPVLFPDTGTSDFRIGLLFSNRDLVGSMYAMGTAAFDANVAVQLDTAVFVAAASGVAPDVARAAIESLADAYPTATVLDQTEFKAAQSESFNQLLGLVYVLLILAILIALLGIANTLALSIFERTHELGLLRAVGMTRSQTRSMVRWESVIIAVFGSLLGLVIGVFFGWALVTALSDEGITRFVVPVGSLSVIVALAACAGILAAVVPARRAARLDVLAAMATR